MVLAEAAASTAHPATATPISTSSSLSNANVTWPSKNLSPLVTEVNRERVLSPVQHQYVSKLQEGIQSSGRKDTGATALLVSRLRQQRERSGGISPSPSEGIITQGSEPRIFAKQVTDPSTYRPLSPFQVILRHISACRNAMWTTRKRLRLLSLLPCADAVCGPSIS